jgi:hypothetical protein
MTPAAVAVPLLLALLSGIQIATGRHAAQFLVLPPFAVIIYSIFSLPRSNAGTLRSVVLLPCIGAIAGELSGHYLGMTPQGVAVATIAVLVAQALLRASMPPALALAVLAMLLHADTYAFALGVFEGTAIIFIAFRFWLYFDSRRPLATRSAESSRA